MADLGEIYSYSYHTNIQTKSTPGSSMLTGLTSSKDPTKNNWFTLPENALTEFSNKFSVGPFNNEFVFEYTYGNMTRDFHWHLLPSVDNVIVKQSFMVAFYVKVRANDPLVPTSREVKDSLLKGGDMRRLVNG